MRDKPAGNTWERRRARRYGSEHAGWHETETVATKHAYTDIEVHGNVGRIEQVDRVNRILYYDVYSEPA